MIALWSLFILLLLGYIALYAYNQYGSPSASVANITNPTQKYVGFGAVVVAAIGAILYAKNMVMPAAPTNPLSAMMGGRRRQRHHRR